MYNVISSVRGIIGVFMTLAEARQFMTSQGRFYCGTYIVDPYGNACN